MIFGRKKQVIRRVLIVEDEPLVAFDNEHFLTDAGYAVVGTTDRARTALALLKASDELDLILLDMNLSDGDGLRVAEAAAAEDVPVLFVTGSCPKHAQHLAIGCLAKPYLPRDLVAAIRTVEDVIAGRRLRKAPAGLTLFGTAAAG